MRINSRVLNENAIINDVFLVIQSIARILFAKNLIFDNLESLTHDNLIDVKFDFYNKLRFAQIDLRIREELELYILLITQEQILTLFNIFTKTKNFDKNAIMIKRQVYFNNALNARDIYKLRSFKTNYTLIYNDKVYIIILIYYDN